MNTQKTQKGFTIIEVVLVLAIAGLIFLMVFVALPALQRGSRDTARKNDVTAVGAAVTSYTSNNRGAFPNSAGLRTYVNNLSGNSNIDDVTVASSFSSAVTVDDGEIVVVRAAKCGESTRNDEGQGLQRLNSGSNRQYVVITRIEAGNGVAYCIDS